MREQARVGNVRSYLHQTISHFSLPIFGFCRQIWNLGFRVNLSDSRISRNDVILSGDMKILIGFDWRVQLI
jgi:hypothetical protein